MMLKILTPGDAVAEIEVEWASLPGEKGRFTAMQGHDVLLTTLVPGVVRCCAPARRGEGAVEEFMIERGMAEVTRDSIIVCVSRAERAERPKGG